MNPTAKPTLSTDSALFVGDTHGDTGWFKSVVLRTAVKNGIHTIIQVGDFGYWPSSRKFMQAVKTSREKFGIDIWFIDGNHEHFPKLNLDVRAAQAASGVPAGNRDPVELTPGFFYLARGSRVSVAGRSVACVGGAASIDRADRIAGTDWFPEERISDSDIESIEAGGRADILVMHDAPSGYDIPGLPPESQRPNSWILEMPSCDEHRERVREVLELVTPSVLIHGHYHAAYERTHVESWGSLKTYGLDRNTHRGWGVIMREVDGELAFRWVDDETPAF